MDFLRQPFEVHAHFHSVHREINYESSLIIPNFECNYTFPIDLALHGIPFGDESINRINFVDETNFRIVLTVCARVKKWDIASLLPLLLK